MFGIALYPGHSMSSLHGNEAMFGRVPCLLGQYTEQHTEHNTELYTKLYTELYTPLKVRVVNVYRVMTFMHAASFQFNTKPSPRMQLSSYLIILPMIT